MSDGFPFGKTKAKLRLTFVSLLLIGGMVLGGCQVSERATRVAPTRTPKPTFTPVVDTPTPPVVVEAVSGEEPTPTITPTPRPTEVVQVAAVAPAPAEAPAPTPTATWVPAPPPSPAAARIPQTGRAILIDQDQQQMYIFENGVVVRTIPCSTGDPSKHGTLDWEGTVGDYVGTFWSFGTYSDYGWYLFRDKGSILIHGAPYTIGDDGRKIYQDLEALGRYPNSHGCIRIHPDEALWFTFWNPRGVPIIITPWTGGAPLVASSDH